MTTPTSLADRLCSVRERIAAACGRAKRDPKSVTLIAVTKSAAPDAIREILRLGVIDLAENRVQQLTQRASQFAEQAQRRKTTGEAAIAPRWHMLGHLQRNKVKPLLPLVHCIHSVDSLRSAEEIDAAAARLNRKVPVMLQVNASEEPQKSGVAVGAAYHLGEQMADMPNLQLAGLMTMAEHTGDEAVIRSAFRRTREIFEEMKWQKIGGAGFEHLSMGMSNDFELAVEEGSTMVRIGSELFGLPGETAESDESA